MEGVVEYHFCYAVVLDVHRLSRCERFLWSELDETSWFHHKAVAETAKPLITASKAQQNNFHHYMAFGFLGLIMCLCRWVTMKNETEA